MGRLTRNTGMGMGDGGGWWEREGREMERVRRRKATIRAIGIAALFITLYIGGCLLLLILPDLL